MTPVYRLLDSVRNAIRTPMRRLARLLDHLSRGRLTPDTVTIIGLLAHIPIGYLIAIGHFSWAAGLLLIFGLFDTLDGELARLQHRASSAGMLIDASTDRFKEVFLYSGIAYWLIGTDRPYFAVWALAACGASICVSYVKAKGETAVKDTSLTSNEINRLFQDGLMRFEVRMFVLIIALLTEQLGWAMVLLAVLAGMTAIGRLASIRRKLRSVQG